MKLRVDIADFACTIGLGLLGWGTWKLWGEGAAALGAGVALVVFATIRAWRRRGPAE